MLQNKTLAMTVLFLALSAGAANAHEIPPITSGDPFTITEGAITWNGTTGSSLNDTLLDTNVLAYHFDVTSAGLLDVYTDDHDDPISNANLFIYQKDAVGADWTLVQHNNVGEGPVSGPTNPDNIFGVHRTGYLDQNNVGTSDAGVRANFDVGSYVALVVGQLGYTTGQDPITNPEGSISPEGIKLSAGLSWSYFGPSCVDMGICSGVPSLSDFHIQTSPGSLAVAGPTVESVPVPGAIWLMGSVLAGFGAFGRKKAIAA